MKANGTLPVIFHAVLISVLLSWCVRTAAAEPVAEQDLQSANADFAFNLRAAVGDRTARLQYFHFTLQRLDGVADGLHRRGQ